MASQLKTQQKSEQWHGLERAVTTLDSVRSTSRLALWMPIPLGAISIWIFGIFMEQWWKDPFVVAILSVFVIGQLLALRQHLLLIRGSKRVRVILAVLDKMPVDGVQRTIESIRNLTSTHLGDLMLRVLRVAGQGHTGLAQSLMDSAAQRRALYENRKIGQHISINRLILKLGFLGTLIGLLQTFPPMKEAILALRSSDGELKFVTDIARAIDGDHYAIFTTLIATAISLLIEIVSIQLIEKSFMRFEMVNSHLEEWILGEGLAVVAHGGEGDRARSAPLTLPKDPLQASAQLQEQMHQNLETLAQTVHRTTRRIEDVVELQQGLERRLERLVDLKRSAENG